MDYLGKQIGKTCFECSKQSIYIHPAALLETPPLQRRHESIGRIVRPSSSPGVRALMLYTTCAGTARHPATPHPARVKFLLQLILLWHINICDGDGSFFGVQFMQETQFVQ